MSVVPPWVPSLEKQLSQRKLKTFSLATLSADLMPRNRTCVARGWLFDKKDSGVLICTTDKRMNKVEELLANDGKFEACFYFAESKKQFRLGGFIQMLTKTQHPSMMPDIPLTTPLKESVADSPSSLSSLTSAMKEDPRYYPIFTPSYDPEKKYDSLFPPPTKEEWIAEYDKHWDALSPKMKATFRKPVPGQPLTKETRNAIDAISRGVDGSSDESGKENFVVLVMFVNSVDYFDDESERRWIFNRARYDEWNEQEVCP